jgi:uncharacterized protein YukE
MGKGTFHFDEDEVRKAIERINKLGWAGLEELNDLLEVSNQVLTEHWQGQSAESFLRAQHDYVNQVEELMQDVRRLSSTIEMALDDTIGLIQHIDVIINR